MLRRWWFVLLLLTSLAAAPLARAAQPCCDSDCDRAMPACAVVCALCATPVAMPTPELPVFIAAPRHLGPALPTVAFDDWIAEIWHPPD